MFCKGPPDVLQGKSKPELQVCAEKCVWFYSRKGEIKDMFRACWSLVLDRKEQIFCLFVCFYSKVKKKKCNLYLYFCCSRAHGASLQHQTCPCPWRTSPRGEGHPPSGTSCWSPGWELWADKDKGTPKARLCPPESRRPSHYGAAPCSWITEISVECQWLEPSSSSERKQ